MLTNSSSPVGLFPGNWYLAVFNKSTNPVSYQIQATEVIDTGYHIVVLTNDVPFDFALQSGAGLTNFFILKVPEPTSEVKLELFNLTGDADFLIGLNNLPSPTSYLISNPASAASPVTVQVHPSPLLTDLGGNWVLAVVNNSATNLQFTVRASFPQTNSVPNTSTNRFFDPEIDASATNICFSWSTTSGRQYRLEAKADLRATNWTTLYGPVTATGAALNFCTNLPIAFTVFRGVEIGSGTSTNPPSTNNGALIDPGLTFGTNGLCLSWSSQPGTTYRLQGKLGITDAGWTNLATVTATAAITTQCLPVATPYHFFQVASDSGASTTNTPPSTNGVTLSSPFVLSNRRLQFVWDTEPGSSYQVQFTTNLLPVVQWTTLTNITASASVAVFTDSTATTNGTIRFYRIITP